MAKIIKYSKVNFAKSGSGSVSGRVVLPKEFLQLLNITSSDRTIIVTYLDGKIIIEKDNNKNIII